MRNSNLGVPKIDDGFEAQDALLSETRQQRQARKTARQAQQYL
jgi:hypothetical protein